MWRNLVLVLISSSAICIGLAVSGTHSSQAGPLPSYRVLEPITEDNLTVFPVVSALTHDTTGFLTLDEGLRSGEVTITEVGADAGLIRPRRPRGELDPGFVLPAPREYADVNHLGLTNHSGRPLLLLAGEIVTGGKQDRVVARDRIVPAHSDSIDLRVFCVEPHRWTGGGDFGPKVTPLAQPSVRSKVMIDRDQKAVWASVGRARGVVMAVSPPAAEELRSTSSYAGLIQNPAVEGKIRNLAAPIEHSYSKLESQLRVRNAVGVVAAVNGRIIWADIFASSELLHLYWPKLVRSYAAEALGGPERAREPSLRAAQEFLDDWNGCDQSGESDAGVYRLSEIYGEGFTAFRLTSLVPHTGFDVHVAKIAEGGDAVCAQ